MTQQTTNTPLEDLAHQLLKIGTLLMSNGADTHRTRKTLQRIAENFHCYIDLNITPQALSINVYNDTDQHFHSGLKQITHYGINFKLVADISIMSWKVVQDNWSLDQINRKISTLTADNEYPRWLVLLMVSLACASFCRLFGGEWLDMLVTLAASCCGLFVKQTVLKAHFNPYLCTTIAAFVASLIACYFVKYTVHIHDAALYASVLFLIPGVPFINSFSDLLNNDILNGLVRSVHGLLLAFAIALGFLISTQICHWHSLWIG